MFPQQVHGYLRNFFEENKCQIVNDSDHYMTVQLTIDMDKRLMNRPFYWRYLESTNGVPNPAQLTLITDQIKLDDNIKGEVVHFGSPRLNQLFQATKELGAFVQMFERVDALEIKIILTPWLGVNYKVSYYSDQTKEMLYSFGINLMTGNLIDDFQESLSGVDLVSVMPENAFHLPYIIKPLRALERLNVAIENIIQQDDHTWAEEAKKRWRKDQQVLEYFYDGIENKPECYELEKKAMEEQYDTRIKVEIVNGGLFYMK
ncbi:YqhG family protein [Viridibacillus sp. YIM B01967]|uniref:YqhG family protein n=1 Tax=Viridibacillus soli TaxID=2798301 RepID=A0ABS1H3X2_9BACL|nr:YqhG family protein [Viridibacillus soli]MBK3494123.1 YqhG family protein [Viridibacillus soli]